MIQTLLPRTFRRAHAGAAFFAALFVAACTCTTGGGFRVTKPVADEHLPAGDIAACVTSVPGDACTFPPKAYEVTLDDPTTGYALTLNEARPVLDAAAGASKPVSTGGCSTG